MTSQFYNPGVILYIQLSLCDHGIDSVDQVPKITGAHCRATGPFFGPNVCFFEVVEKVRAFRHFFYNPVLLWIRKYLVLSRTFLIY